MNITITPIVKHTRMVFYFGFLSYCFGIVGARAHAENYWVLLVSLSCIILLWWGYRQVLVFLICITCFVVGVMRYETAWNTTAHAYQTLETITMNFDKKLGFEGTLIDELYTGDTRDTYRLKIDNFDITSTYRVTVEEPIYISIALPNNLDISPGNVIRVEDTIDPVIVDHASISSFAGYLWYHDVVGTSSPYAFSSLHYAAPGWLDIMRAKTKKIIHEGFPKNVAGLFLGITIGNTDLFTSKIRSIFQSSGLTHILVVSGSNILFVIMIIQFFLKYLPIKIYGKVAIIACFLGVYGSIVGWDTPVIRATIMGIIGYLGIRSPAGYRSFSVLVGVAWGYLLFAPEALIFDASFGLSFAATLGILLGVKPIERILTFCHIPKICQPLLSVTLAASLGSFPILIYYFGTFPIFSIVSNILVGGILGVLLIIVTIYIIVTFVIPVSWLYYLGMIPYIFGQYILSVAEYFSTFPSIVVPDTFRVWCVCFGMILWYFYGIYRENKHLLKNTPLLPKTE